VAQQAFADVEPIAPVTMPSWARSDDGSGPRNGSREVALSILRKLDPEGVGLTRGNGGALSIAYMRNFREQVIYISVEADTDGDGFRTEAEFLSTLPPRQDVQDLLFMFREIDTDGDGRVSRPETEANVLRSYPDDAFDRFVNDLLGMDANADSVIREGDVRASFAHWHEQANGTDP
jgi:hypothetical protein